MSLRKDLQVIVQGRVRVRAKPDLGCVFGRQKGGKSGSHTLEGNYCWGHCEEGR